MSMQNWSKFDGYMVRSSAVFDLLSEKNRLSIYAILSYGEITVTGIYKCLQLPQNLISHHLKTLKNHGLIISRREGRKIYYSLNNQKILELKEILDRVLKPSN